MIETDLPAFLAGDAGIGALVVSGNLKRVFPLMIPQHTFKETTKLPCLVYRRVSTQRQPLFCRTDSLVQGSFQLDAYAPEYEKALQLAEALRKALIDFTGQMGATFVDRVFLEFEADFEDPEPGLYHISHTYTVWYLEE